MMGKRPLAFGVVVLRFGWLLCFVRFWVFSGVLFPIIMLCFLSFQR